MVAPLTLALYAISRRSKAVREGEKLQKQMDREDAAADRAYEREQNLIRLRIEESEKSQRRLGEEAMERERTLRQEARDEARTIGVIGYDLREGLEGNEQGLMYYDPSKGHDFELFDKKYLQFGNNNPEAIPNVPQYEPFYLNKKTGMPVSTYAADKKDDFVFGGYRNKNDPSDIRYIPDPFMKSLLERPKITVDPIKTQSITIKAFDAQGNTKTFDNEQDADKHMAKPEVQKYYEDNGLKPEYVREVTSVTTKGDKETERSTTTNRIAPLVTAANKVDKEETPTVSFSLKPDVVKGQNVDRPDVSLFSTTDQPGEDLLKFDLALKEAGLRRPEDAEKIFQEMYQGGSYATSLRSLAGYIVQSEQFVSPKTGLVAINSILVEDPETYLTRYGSIRLLPGIVEALNQATTQTAAGVIRSLKEKNSDLTGNTDSLEGHYDPEAETGAESTGQRKMVVVSTLPDEYRDTAREFQEEIAQGAPGLLKLLYPAAPNAMAAAETYIQDNFITYVPNTDLQQVSDEQPFADYVTYLKQTRVGGKADGETFFSVFRRTVDGTSTVYSPVEEQVLKSFIANDALTFDQKINFMMIMTANKTGLGASGTTFRGLANTLALDPEVDYSDFKEEKAAVATAYGNAEQMITAFIATFYDSDGNLLPLGTKASTVALGVDGVLYYYDEFVRPLVQSVLGTDANPFAPVKEIDNRTEAIAEMEKSLFGQGSKFATFLDNATEADRRKEAARRGMSYDTFMAQEAAARTELQSMFRKTSLIGDDEANLQYALRGYYRFMTAYSLASAVQGGTGGRTISDQDVLNFLKAFNTDRFFSDPKVEVGVLDRVLQSIQFQRKLASNIAQRGTLGERTARATMKYMSFPGANVNLSMRRLSKQVGVDIDNVGGKPVVSTDDETDESTTTGYTQQDIDSVVADQKSNAFTSDLIVSTPVGTVKTMDELIELNPGLDYDTIDRILGRKK